MDPQVYKTGLITLYQHRLTYPDNKEIDLLALRTALARLEEGVTPQAVEAWYCSVLKAWDAGYLHRNLFTGLYQDYPVVIPPK